MKCIYLILALFISFSNIHAQTGKSEYLSIGDICPNLIFPDLINSKKASLKMSDFKGKLVIIDFFGTFCIPCVKALPKMDSLQRKFKYDLQIITVSSEFRHIVNDFFTRLKMKQEFSMPFVAEDTTLYRLFKHSYIPFYVIIGKDGLIKAMPPPEMVNME